MVRHQAYLPDVLGDRQRVGSGDRYLNHLYTIKKWHAKQERIQIVESITPTVHLMNSSPTRSINIFKTKFFELKTKESQEIVNSQLIEFLEEWRQDAPSRYRKAKDDICYWITDEWYSLESPMQKEIVSAYQTAFKKKDDMAIALALSPFAQQTAELVNSGAYEAAASSCYVIFRCLAKTCKEHEDWFRGFTGYGDPVMPKPNTVIIPSWICAPCGGCGRRKGENEIKGLRKP